MANVKDTRCVTDMQEITVKEEDDQEQISTDVKKNKKKKRKITIHSGEEKSHKSRKGTQEDKCEDDTHKGHKRMGNVTSESNEGDKKVKRRKKEAVKMKKNKKEAQPSNEDESTRCILTQHVITNNKER